MKQKSTASRSHFVEGSAIPKALIVLPTVMRTSILVHQHVASSSETAGATLSILALYFELKLKASQLSTQARNA
eukprot:121546-Pleurochrysis_carterae.AAC.1